MAWARSIARRWHFIEDVEQAAYLGLHTADVAAAPDMPEREFRWFASVRIRGEIIDHLRRVAHGGRRQGERNLRPREPEPESVAMAVALGRIPGRFATDDPELEAAEREAQRAALEAIERLPPRDRDILLRRLAGEPEASIAAEYKIAIPRVSQICWDAASVVKR